MPAMYPYRCYECGEAFLSSKAEDAVRWCSLTCLRKTVHAILMETLREARGIAEGGGTQKDRRAYRNLRDNVRYWRDNLVEKEEYYRQEEEFEKKKRRMKAEGTWDAYMKRLREEVAAKRAGGGTGAVVGTAPPAPSPG